MKKIILIVAVLAPVLLFAQEKPFKLTGKIGDHNLPMKIFLAKSMSPDDVIDSSALRNGKFTIKGKLDVAQHYMLVLARSSAELKLPGRGARAATGPAPAQRAAIPDYKWFFLDKGQTTINGPDLKQAKISGASELVNNEYDELQKALRPVWNMNGDVGAMWQAASKEEQETPEFLEKYNAAIDAADKENLKVVSNFIRSHPRSAISLYALRNDIIGGAASVHDVKALLNELAPEIKNSSWGEQWAKTIEKKERTAPGAMAPDFEEPDVNGKAVKLSDFRGKYVLLDFWASWCVPCRKENPHVVEAFKNYGGKNFTILSVSLDKAKAPWLKAIEADGLTWTHVSALKGFDGNAAAQYAISSIPASFLIDPDGKIIAVGLRGEALDKKLSEVLHVGAGTATSTPTPKDDQKAFDLKLKPITDKEQLFMDTMINNYQADPVKANGIYDAQLLTLLPQKKKLIAEFVKEHPDSHVSLTALDTYIQANSDISEVGPLYDMLSDKVKNTPKGKKTGEIIGHLRNVAMGAQAPVFAQHDPSGKLISLTDFKGKYVLIDFWASWCLPCRAENPNVVKVYNEFKNKRFAILGVSLDDEKTKDAWIKAIEKDNLAWTHISDLKQWDNAAAKQYGVRAIPANFLIDPNGKIIAKNLKGDDLRATLNKYLN